MFDINRCFHNNRLMKALTSLSIAEFYALVPRFQLELAKASSQKLRKRKPGAGHPHTLKSMEMKFFFILFYVKCYPTFDVAGFIFGVDRSQPCRWVQVYLPIVEAALGREVVLPVRQVRSVEEFILLFPEAKELFVDGTERPTQRPQDPKEQKDHYSGKKKRHTKKNIVVTDQEKHILILTETEKGKTHDKTAADKVFDHLPEDRKVHVDLGFLGVPKEQPHLSIIIPKKKPRKKELSDEQKENNRQKAKIRIKVEHAISGVKRLRCVTDVFRNKKENMDDELMLLACGLWNFHLKKAA